MSERAPAARLPLLAERRAALETCGYCPKLCRATCPVSNVEPRETLIPWGKMSTAWFTSRGDAPVDEEHARISLACTGCFACRERCEHENPVAETLADARADYFAAGVAPAEVTGVAAAFAEREAEHRARIGELRRVAGVEAGSKRAVLLGCSYARHAPTVARDALRAVIALGGPVRLVDACCGAPLYYAGDRPGFARARSALERAAGSAELVVVDPGCAWVLGDRVSATLVDLAVRDLERLGRWRGPDDERPVRWHDPCLLGRGLGKYDEPRAVLGRVLGRPVAEFPRAREHAVCSGAGGLLPVTMPDASRAIAARRLEEHSSAGGGTVVTACASSLRRLGGVARRSTGPTPVVDLATVIFESLTPHG